MGMDHTAKTVIIEELSRVSGAMGAMVQASQLGVAGLVHFGNPLQKQTWLPRIARGEVLPTIAVTEPDSGGHVLGMAATAVRDGGDYVLNGTKCHVGNSEVGDLHKVVVRTGDGSRGLSAFLVEATRPGCRLGPHRRAMGLHGFGFGHISFEDCRVPAANLLGNEGDGLAVALSSSLLYGRPNLGAVALGIHQALVEATVAYAARLYRYGRPLYEIPVVKARIGEMRSRLDIARLALYDAVSRLDQGLPCDSQLINAKLVNAEYAVDSARAALEVHGAAGLFCDLDVERLVRDAFHILAPAGTSDIQRLRLAEDTLGIGKGEWSQRFGAPVDVQNLDAELDAEPAF
jgi:alkylation response protein AidB-like acyl-CoA dehydrogenase